MSKPKLEVVGKPLDKQKTPKHVDVGPELAEILLHNEKMNEASIQAMQLLEILREKNAQAGDRVIYMLLDGICEKMSFDNYMNMMIGFWYRAEKQGFEGENCTLQDIYDFLMKISQCYYKSQGIEFRN